jgi:hypothetical protein
MMSSSKDILGAGPVLHGHRRKREGNTCDINYSSKELMIWHHNDNNGRSWFYRPANAKGVGIECWHVFMSKGDYARELFWEQQMMRRKNLFQGHEGK